jgi:hypothetical protein
MCCQLRCPANEFVLSCPVSMCGRRCVLLMGQKYGAVQCRARIFVTILDNYQIEVRELGSLQNDIWKWQDMVILSNF